MRLNGRRERHEKHIRTAETIRMSASVEFRGGYGWQRRGRAVRLDELKLPEDVNAIGEVVLKAHGRGGHVSLGSSRADT